MLRFTWQKIVDLRARAKYCAIFHLCNDIQPLHVTAVLRCTLRRGEKVCTEIHGMIRLGVCGRSILIPAAFGRVGGPPR